MRSEQLRVDGVALSGPELIDGKQCALFVLVENQENLEIPRERWRFSKLCRFEFAVRFEFGSERLRSVQPPECSETETTGTVHGDAEKE